MATQKKNIKKIKTKDKSVHLSKKNSQKILLSEYFRLGDSYSSFLLGILLVIIFAVLLTLVFKTRTSNKINDLHQGTTSISSIVKELNKITPTPSEKSVSLSSIGTYEVKQDDNLWKIAEQQYKDGYKWVFIAKANKLNDPSLITIGNKLIIPRLTSGQQRVQPEDKLISGSSTVGSKITGNSYVISKGDDLWHISIQAYGNGYRWTEIAKINNLIDPNLIHAGNKILIPR